MTFHTAKSTHNITLRADSRFALSQSGTSLQSNAVFHWLVAKLESVLTLQVIYGTPNNYARVCVTRPNWAKRRLDNLATELHIIRWHTNYQNALCNRYILSMVLKELTDGACFTLRGRGFQRVGAVLEKARFPSVSSRRHLGELRIYWSSERRAVVVHILILMLWDIVKHGHSVPCRWGAEFCHWSHGPWEANAIPSTQG